jgi:uncharacterized OB-fold protein
MEILHKSGCERCGNELSPAFRFCPHCGTSRGSAESNPSAELSLHTREGVLS